MALDQIKSSRSVDIGVMVEISAAIAQARTPAAMAHKLTDLLSEFGLANSARIEFEPSPAKKRALAGSAQRPNRHISSLTNKEPILRTTIPSTIDYQSQASLVFDGPTQELTDLAPAIAAQVGMALDRNCLDERVHELNAQAERRISEVSTIYEIGRAMDVMEIGHLLEVITEKAAKVMSAQACSLMRLSPDTHSLTIAASYGLSEDVVHVTQRALGEGIAGTVAQTGEPMLIVDPQTDPRLIGVALRAEIGSSMVVPMKDEQGKVTGVLSIRRRSPAPAFDEDSLRLFSVFASQAALVISNAQLYSDLRRRVVELSTLSDLTQSVIATLDLSSLLEVVADRITHVVKFDRCAIFLQDRALNKKYVVRVMRGYRPDVVARTPVRSGEGVVGIVAKKQMPIFETDARNALQPMRGYARALGTNAFAAIPIISKGQTVGVVVADNRPSGRIIQSEDVELLTTFVGQAGLAIENATLYEDRDLRYQEMNRLATQTDNILRSILTSVVVVDTARIVTRWNKAAEEFWGISEDATRGVPYATLVEQFGLPSDESRKLIRLMDRAIETGRPDQAYKLTLHPKRRREMVVNVFESALIDRQGERQGAVQIMEDVTREFRLEAEMERIRRLADIGQLAAKMAHEVRNPLSSIKGAAQLMRNEYEDLAPLREFLDIIVDEVNALSRITTELLDFARPMQLDLRWLNLNDLVNRTHTFLTGYLNAHAVRFEFTPEVKLPNILGDPKQIEQVMRNVVINAAQAMPNGGGLSVTTSHNASKETVSVTFSDEGVGIAGDRLDEIFQPFVTSKTKGTGLGLPIVRKIVENHGGTIDVISKIGEGAAFCVTLPIRPMVSEPPARSQIAAPSPGAPTIPDV